MCGIFGCLGNPAQYTRDFFINNSKKLRHRGPDWSGIYMDEVSVLCHERLSIVGVNNGSQPLICEDKNLHLCVNGEIYNYKELNKSLEPKYKPLTKSDCEVILNLYKEYGINCVNHLDGIFSFALYDKKNGSLFVARDPIGIIPLYYGYDKHDTLFVASEQKALSFCSELNIFPPGTAMLFKLNSLYVPKLQNSNKYYTPDWHFTSYRDIEEEQYLCKNIERTLTHSVEKRLMSDVPFGVLLSGGLDSSLIASIASRIMENNESNFFGDRLHSFSIGLENAPDLAPARKVANFLGTIHHEFNFTIQEGLDVIRDLIYHLETYDITTIRASAPMFLLARKIKAMGIKMVLSGEGADEVFGGYLYFHNAPSDDDFHSECKKRVLDLHHFDCLRANKSTMSWGLEARVPFLDKECLDLMMRIHPKQKCNKIEKYILRKSFDNKANPYLPDDILWRQKEQFSDGVGYSWIDRLKEECENKISNEEYDTIIKRYKNDDIKSKEAAYYRKVYEDFFPNKGHIVKRWVPQQNWPGVGYDPSGRAQQIHNSTTITE